MSGAKVQASGEEVIKARELAAEVDSSDSSGHSRAVSADGRAARRVEILSLRLAGFSAEQIASRVGLSDQTVRDIISETLQNTANRQVAELRNLENERLDRAQMAVWPKVIEGDLKAIDTFLKISQQRSKINGLYAPTKIDMRVGIRHEMDQALADLERLMQEQANEIVQGEVIHRGSIDGRIA